MLENAISQLVQMFPRGTTDGQLLWRLRGSGLRNDPSSILAALTALADRGEIYRERGRWMASGREPAQAKAGANAGGHGGSPASAEVLRAVRMVVQRAPAGSGPPDLDASVPGIPAWRPLLAYYAATQRQDPRGSVERFPDQHEFGWQLFDCAGAWWEAALLTVSVDQLPPTFRQALAMIGRTGSAAVGWPMTVVRGREGTSCLPGLLLPVNWELAPTSFTITLQEVPPTLNPAWVRHIRRRTDWREDSLTDALFGDQEDADLGAIAPRLAHALAAFGGARLRPADLAAELSLTGEGLRNAAALFLPDDSAFSRRVAQDLEAIADWPEGTRRDTALSALLEDGPRPQSPSGINLLSPLPLSESQGNAAESGLSRSITAIQGPPGTGKSQTIVALIASALTAKRSVLFVARNHRALDEVEERIAALFPDIPVVTRGRDAEGARDNSLSDALTDLVSGGVLDPGSEHRMTVARESLVAEARAAATARAAIRTRDALHLELSTLVDRADALRDGLPDEVTRKRRLKRLLEAIVRVFRRSGDAPPPENASLAVIEGRIDRLERELAAAPVPPEPVDPDAFPRLGTVVAAMMNPDPDTHEYLRYLKAELEFQPGGLKPHSIPAEDARILLGLRPVWAISSLSVPARIPLVPALFDLAIFDEASQCDIASALPVLARARQAVVVGDPEQLRFIPGLGRAQEHALMSAAGLPAKGRAALAQSVNSLFDFTALRTGADGVHLLTDQFRSAPDIVDYVSRAFYKGRLVAQRTDEEFQPPRDYRPGLHWEDVRGQTGREDGGNINRAEAEFILARIRILTEEADFDGSVGVISPFNAQVGLISRLAAAALTEAERDRIRLRVGTVDRWQGGEADVIFFSLVTAAGAPSSATSFLSRERRRINVAVSRARAVAVMVGDLGWARACGIAHISDLADRATRPREQPLRGYDSRWERRMHEALRRRGLEAQPQYPVGSRSLDFALFGDGVRLDLEVDGRTWHIGAGGSRKTADRQRDRELTARGWKVRRFWVHELAADMEGCLDIIERDLGRN